MKCITELHNKYKNQPIWLVGSGPTLEDYPDNFLDNKISIALHLAYLKFPNTTYNYFSEYDRLSYLVEKEDNIFNKKIIVGWPFYGKTQEESLKLIKDFKEVYYMKRLSFPPDGKMRAETADRSFEYMKKRVKVAKKASSNLFYDYTTCAHMGMYAAIILGGNPINIIGCDFRSIDGKEHYGIVNKIDAEMRPTFPSFSESSRGNYMRKGMESIIEGCKEEGIRVNWYSNYLEFKKKYG